MYDRHNQRNNFKITSDFWLFVCYKYFFGSSGILSMALGLYLFFYHDLQLVDFVVIEIIATTLIAMQVLFGSKVQFVSMNDDGISFSDNRLKWSQVRKIKLTFLGLYKLDVQNDDDSILFVPSDLTFFGINVTETDMEELIKKMRRKYGFLV